MKDRKIISGTKEWSVLSVNCVLGCPHQCRYCYASCYALDRGQISKRDDWGTQYHRIRPAEIKKGRRFVEGPVMFPTTHDITPEHLEGCMTVIDKLLAAGNQLLIVSKPHFECIKSICEKFSDYKEKILFRFSIGALSDSILSYWEPGAPPFAERYAALQYAYEQGFNTSISCEPLLEAERAVELWHKLKPYVKDTVWFGKLNGIGYRLIPGTDPKEIARITQGQTEGAIKALYGFLRDDPQVRWKESYKAVLGLELAKAAGLDT